MRRALWTLIAQKLTLRGRGNRLSVALEAVPEESTIPYLSYNVSLTISFSK